MSNIEESKQNDISQNKLQNLIEEDINLKNEEDLKSKILLNKSTFLFKPIKNNNFFQIEEKDRLSKNDKELNTIKRSQNNQFFSLKQPKTEVLPKNKLEMIKKGLIDFEQNDNQINENIIEPPKKIQIKKKEYQGIEKTKLVLLPISLP